jgi:hypothetical protein
MHGAPMKNVDITALYLFNTDPRDFNAAPVPNHDQASPQRIQRVSIPHVRSRARRYQEIHSLFSKRLSSAISPHA